MSHGPWFFKMGKFIINYAALTLIIHFLRSDLYQLQFTWSRYSFCKIESCLLYNYWMLPARLYIFVDLVINHEDIITVIKPIGMYKKKTPIFFHNFLFYDEIILTLLWANHNCTDDKICVIFLHKDLRITVWHHKACRVMTNGDPEGRIFLFHPHMNNEFFFLLTIYFLF